MGTSLVPHEAQAKRVDSVERPHGAVRVPPVAGEAVEAIDLAPVDTPACGTFTLR
jgi:hypothetical protein